MMSYVNFQTQITTIMETMTKSGIAEITKLFEDTSSVLCLKISQSLRENDALKNKLQLVQHELRARGQKIGIAGLRESPVNTRSIGVQVFGEYEDVVQCKDIREVEEQGRESVFGQECSFSLRRDEEPACVEESAKVEEVRTEPVLIKPERLVEDLCYSCQDPILGGEEQRADTSPVEGEQNTEPKPVGDPEELSKQHRCGYGDEELSELEFVVKAEEEEEHVAQRLNQTRCEHSAGRLNNLGSESEMYGRDSQLWASFTQGDSDIESNDPVCSNASEQCSQVLPIHRQLQHAPVTTEVSGNTLSSFGASYVEEFDHMGEKLFVCSEKLRPEAIHTQQGQYRERSVHTVEGENQTLLPQQQQHGPSVKHLRGSTSPAQPHSGTQYETGSTSVFNTGKKGKTDVQTDVGKKPFICIYCGKSFDYCSNLISHHRIHTGEKPYSCAQCGMRFSLKGNLVKHERLHSGYKPFGCTQCGKRFARGSNLRSHHRIHTGERPYHCTRCGKSFTNRSNLVVHQRIHTGMKPYSCN